MKNAMLLLLVGVVTVIPFFLQRDSEFEGADGQAQEVIAELAPSYQPWFNALWEPPGAEIESLLFSIQAAIGAAVIGYIIGYGRARRKFTSNIKNDRGI